MKWRAINNEGKIVEGDSYQEVKNLLFSEDHKKAWVIEYYDSDNEWIELENLEFAPQTDEILVTRASHKEHAA